MYRPHLFGKTYRNEADGNGDGGGGPAITPELQAIIDAQVNNAVSGLKAKNSELIGKLKEAGENLKRFDGIEPDAVRSILKRFSDEEEAGLIAAGKLDEVLNKRTERMKGDYDKKLGAEAEARAKAEAKAQKLAQRTLAGALRDAAIKTGALPEAMDDIVLRAGGLWRLNDDGEAVAMNGDEVILGKDGKTPLTPMEWAESLRETAPHLWPKAQGTNAPGSSAGSRGTQPKKASAMTPAEKAAYIGEHGLEKWQAKVSADYGS
jgi:hypothetical protein